MANLYAKNFSNADEVKNPPKAKVEVVKLGNVNASKLVLEPGWKWSNDVKPHVGTESCQTKHLGYIAQGTVCVKMDDGTEASYSAGQAYSIDAGHDGWVVGDEKAVMIEFHGAWGE